MSRRNLGVLRPRADTRRDPPVLVEVFRFSDGALALLTLLAAVLLAPRASLSGWSGGGALAGISLRLLDVVLIGGFLAWWNAAYVLLGMYGTRGCRRRGDELVTVAVASALGCAILLPYAFLDSTPLSPLGAAGVWATSTLLVLGSRRLLRTAWSAFAPAPARRMLIVGSGRRARRLLAELRGEGGGATRIVGYVDAEEGRGRMDAAFLGVLDDLEGVLRATAVDVVLIALPVRSRYAEIQQTIEVCERIGVGVEYPADVFRSARGEPRLDPSGSGAVVALGESLNDGPRRVKRALDVAGAATGLLLLAPLMVVIALAVRLSGPGPVLFVQQRCGRNRKFFAMYKFRTMVWNAEALQPELEHLNEAGGPVFKIRRDPRVTPVGRLLRRTSLDELPQLFNVLRGDMSLVGPRPLPLRDVHRFPAVDSLRRFSVRPGLTCLWQVNGRCEIGFDDWVNLDLQYIDRWSLLLDLRILARTVPAVLWGKGAV